MLGLSNTLIATLVALSWTISSTGPVSAQQAGAKKMYRCGTNFQDKPCDGGAPVPVASAPAAATAKAAPAAKAVAPAAPEPTKMSAAEARSAQQKQIRCENFSRQATELRDRQKATPQYAESIGVQLKSLESRMSADSC